MSHSSVMTKTKTKTKTKTLPKKPPRIVLPEDGQPEIVESRPRAQALSKAPVKVVKTKRTLAEALVPMNDEERYALNKRENDAALNNIYDQFYNRNTGGRLDLNGRLNKIYGMMGTGTSEYMRTAITHDEFLAFNRRDGAVWTNSQKVSAYEKALKAWTDWPKLDPTKRAQTRPPKPVGPKTADEAVKLGDYFHVHNLKKAAKLDQKGKARRIIVNVKSQEAGLNVARAVQGLFTDQDAGPYLKEYKIYLSETAKESAKAKYDKLVIYYVRKDDDSGGDLVGDKIVNAITGSIGPDDVDQGFAPFYSRITPGIAWAEEPKFYVESLPNSFTRTRSNIITDVISKHPSVKDPAAFIRLVGEALKTAGVDPDRPHRHIMEATV